MPFEKHHCYISLPEPWYRRQAAGRDSDPSTAAEAETEAIVALVIYFLSVVCLLKVAL